MKKRIFRPWLALPLMAVASAFVWLAADAQTRRQRAPRETQRAAGAVFQAERFAGEQICAKIQAAVDAAHEAGGGTVVVQSAGDCGGTTDASQVRVRSGVTLRLPPGEFSYSLRGYGGKYKTPGQPRGGNLVGALFLLESDTVLEGSGPSTVLRESSWIHTKTPGASTGENTASFVVIADYASAYSNGSTSRNITVRNLKIAEGKPSNVPQGFTSAGGALNLGNCHNCLVENVHLENIHGIGIHVGGASDLGLDPGPDLVARGVTTPLGRYAEGVIVRNNTLTGVASQNIALVNGRSIRITGNTMRDPGYLSKYAAGCTPIDVEPNTRTDIVEDVSIDNNVIESTTRTWAETGGTKLNYGIIVQNGARAGGWNNVSVTNNRVVGAHMGLRGHGVSGACLLLRNNVRNVQVTGNHFERCQYGIRVDYNAQNSRITNNKVISAGFHAAYAMLLDWAVGTYVADNHFSIDPRSALKAGEDVTIAEISSVGPSSNNKIVNNRAAVTLAAGSGSVAENNCHPITGVCANARAAAR